MIGVNSRNSRKLHFWLSTVYGDGFDFIYVRETVNSVYFNFEDNKYNFK